MKLKDGLSWRLKRPPGAPLSDFQFNAVVEELQKDEELFNNFFDDDPIIWIPASYKISKRLKERGIE
jgi:hypothetical protein